MLTWRRNLQKIQSVRSLADFCVIYYAWRESGETIYFLYTSRLFYKMNDTSKNMVYKDVYATQTATWY